LSRTDGKHSIVIRNRAESSPDIFAKILRQKRTQEELAALARHCTEQEDAANKVERRVRKSAAAMFLSDRIGEIFDALATGASEKGTWVRVLQPPVEGKLVEGDRGVDVGDRLRVKLVNVNVEKGFVDFMRVKT
jgi:exoribonuclease-2